VAEMLVDKSSTVCQESLSGRKLNGFAKPSLSSWIEAFQVQYPLLVKTLLVEDPDLLRWISWKAFCRDFLLSVISVAASELPQTRPMGRWTKQEEVIPLGFILQLKS